MKRSLKFSTGKYLSIGFTTLAAFITEPVYSQSIPTISRVTPDSGIAGGSVIISGTNFSATATSNIVYFGAVQAVVASASPTNLWVTVPAGATFAPITVTVGGLVASSAQSFEPTFTGDGSSISNSNFAASFNLDAGGGPGSAVIADLDGDGKPDVAFVSGDAHTVSIFRNIGTNGTLSASSFAARVDLPIPPTNSGDNPYRLRAVDVDGDGKLDLIACGVYGTKVSILHNVATPGSLTTNSFESPVGLVVGSDCRFATAADLDADGRMDIVALNYGDKTISIFKNIGSAGSLTTNSFAAPVILDAPGGPYEVAIADLDGDGKPDLAVASSDSGTVTVFQNLAAPGVMTTNSFAPRFEMSGGGGNTSTIAAVDLDGDGWLDLVTGSGTGDSVNVFRNIHAGGLLTTNSFAARVDFGTPGWMHTVSVADFNGDGKPDLGVVGELPSYMAIFQNTGTPGSFTSASLAPRVDFATGYNAWGIAAGDLDGDGRPDVVFCNAYDSTLTIYQNILPFGTQVSCSPPPAGLVGWWKGDGTTLDSFAGNNGVNQNIAYTNGVVGQAFACDPENYSYGTYTGIQIADQPAYALTNSLTIEGWVRPRGDGYVIFFRGDHRPGLDPYQLSMQANSNIDFVICDAGGNYVKVETALPYFVWTHVAATLDGSSGAMSIYTNGVLAAQTNTTSRPFGPLLADQSPGIGIGNVNDGGNNFPFLGDIDEIDLYDRALAVGEIQAIYNAGSAGKCPGPVEPPQRVVLVDTSTPGYYNESLGTILDGTEPQFPLPFGIGTDSTIDPADEPTLAAAAAVLGNWLVPGAVLNGNWLAPGSIPSTWALDTETAIIYEVNGGDHGFTVLRGDFDVDNGIYVWVNGQYKFGARAPGLPSPLGQFEYTNVNLGNLSPGTNRIQIIREDSGISTGYQIRISGTPLTNTPAVSVTLLNVDFGAGTNTTKVGRAAAGMTTNDFWNFYTRDDGVGGWRTFGSVINLQNFDGSVTAAGLTVNNAPGAWNSGSSDPMLDGYIYPLTGGNVTVTITNLPAGRYDVLPYAVNGNFDVSSDGVSYGTNACYASPIVNPPAWADGVHYVRFANVQVNAGQPLVITAHPNVSDVAQIAGLQVAWSSLTNALPPSPVAPWIALQPTNVTVPVSNTAAFSVTAQSSAPLFYQWLFNGTNIFGATGDTLTLSNVQPALAGNYSVVVSNFLGVVTSSNAVLTVLAPPTILAQTPSQVVLLGNPAMFAVNAGGTAPLSFFWSRNNALIPGATNSSYTLNNAQLADSGSQFSCLVTNDYGFALSTNATLKVIDSVANDLCSGAVVVTGFNYTNLQSTAKATSFGDPAPGCVDGFGNGVWYQFTALVNGQLVVDTFGSDFDTGLAVYTGACDALTAVACNDDTGGMTSQVTLPTTAGTTYSILVGGYGAHTGNLVFHLNHLTPPAFVVQPANQSVVAGSNASFGASLTGALPMSFQWFFNGAPLVDDGRIAGSTTASLSISNIITADAGSYTVAATNFLGSASSAAAMLDVLVPPTITTQPVGRSVPPGLPTTFSAAAAGNPAPGHFQWQLNGTNISGATSSTYTISAVNSNHLGFYRLVVSNSVGGTVSAAAQLTFGPVAAWGRNVNNECLPPPGLSNVIGVAGTYQDSFAVRMDGTVAAWGSSSRTNIPASATNVVALFTDGNTGFAALRANGTIASWGGKTPPALSNVVSVALGFYAGFALRAEGTIASWGSLPYSAIPAGLNQVTAIAAGYSHAMALRSDGTVAVWGTGPATNVPAGLANVTAIAAGATHSLALKSNGTVIAWGSGSGTNLPAGLTNIVAISASSYVQTPNLCLAIRSNGKVVAWGDNPYGETNPPAALSNLLSVAIAAAPNHGLALVNDGSPVIIHPPIGLTAFTGRDVTLHGDAVGAQPLSYQWLLNGTNLPGATSTSLVISNVQLANAGSYQLSVSNSISTALSLAAPLTVLSNNTLTVLSQTMASATNVYQGGKIIVSGPTVLGNGPLRYQWFFSVTNKNFAAIPGATSEMLVMDPALALHTGNYYVAVSNQFAGLTSAPVGVRVQFARAWGFQAVSNPPVNVTNAIAIATGGYANYSGHYLALGADGKLTAWANYFASSGETNVAALSNSFVTAIAAGPRHSLALKSDGTVYAWGAGPTNPPAGLNSVVAIASGDYHDLALKSDGSIAGWMAAGQFNYGQATNYFGATNVVAIAAGSTHSLALRADGTVVTWGNGIPTQTIIPPNTTNIIAIAAGYGFSVALRANGTVVQWGSGIANYPVPANLSNVVAISASASHCTALRNDGTVASWGYEYVGLASNNVPTDLANVIAIASGGDHDMALFGTRAPAFTVQPWNRAIILGARTNITLAAKCAGVQPMSYQWQLNGTNVPGATKDTLILTNQPSPQFGPVRLMPTGTYQLVASNAYGVVASKPAKVTTFIPLGDAMDTPVDGKGNYLYNWTTIGNAQWFGETNVTHDGVDAARSGGIGALQETILQTTIGTNQPGSYAFWWKVSSEQYFDTLEFRVNGITLASISGEMDWQRVIIPAAAGTNVLQWRYSKDSSFDNGQDAGWVDQFTYLPAPPVITSQPASRTNYAGTTATFSINASGAAPLGYRWRKNGTGMVNGGNVSGATTFNLLLSNVQDADAASYTVVVTNLGGAVTSSPAILTVLDSPPIITSSPAGRTNNAGTTATFSVTAIGAVPLSYQWLKNGFNLSDGGNVSGASTPGLVLTDVQDADAAGYTVVITNAFGSLTSSPAMLGVIDIAPVITSQPASYTLLPGKTAIFSVTASGTTPFNYQWQFNGTNLFGATNSALQLDNIHAINAGAYRAIVTNAFGSTTSSNGMLAMARSMVVAWGDNTYGQTNVPAELTDVTAISAGWRHNLALQTDQTVVAWGYNGNCTVGVPPGLSNVADISAGGGWGLALKTDGSVVGLECAGAELSTNFNVAGLSNITAISAGWYHWLALKTDGSLATWSVANDSYTPTNIPAGLTNVTAIAAGDEYSVALKADGTVVAWGWNDYGQTNVPPGLSNVIAIAASSVGGRTLALKRDGTVVAWGLDYSGQTEVPAGLSNVVAIAVGQQHSLALKTDGTVIAWGTNRIYTTDPGMTQIPAGLSNVVAIAGGEMHSLALVNDGSPVVIRQPANETVVSNTTVIFSATALGAPSLSYQWRKNGTKLTDGGNVSGATTASLTLSNVQTADMADYTVFVTNAVNHTASLPALLTVIGPPAIMLQPADQTVLPGTNVQFSVTAIGNPSLTYQWWRNGTNPVGGNSPKLTLTSVSRAQNGVYSVMVTNAAGGMLSSNAVLKVIVPQQFGAPALLPNGMLQFSSTDANGGLLSPSDLANFEAQASTNLVDWVTLPGALNLTNGMLQLQDSGQSNYNTRYYRIVEH